MTSLRQVSGTWKLLYSNAVGSQPQVWLRGSLANGQVFNFTCEKSVESDASEIWSGVIGSRLVQLKQLPFAPLDTYLSPVYMWCCSEQDGCEVGGLLNKFFRTEIDVDQLYRQWSLACPRFAKISERFRGIRLLDQDLPECLFSFISSTNNHIPRISKMLNSLRDEFGEVVLGQSASQFKTFPPIAKIANEADEGVLRKLGFGYRAKFITQTAKKLADHLESDPEWLNTLRDPALGNDIVRERLTSLAGVGPKVADCVALFACNRLDVVPVDIHVFELAKRSYDDTGVLKGVDILSKGMYKVVTDLFKTRFGTYAGWAHSVLFTSELVQYRDRLCETLVNEIRAAKVISLISKAEKKRHIDGVNASVNKSRKINMHTLEISANEPETKEK